MKTLVFVWLFLLGSLCAQGQAQPSTQPQRTSATIPSPAQTKIDPAKEADIRQLLDLTGGAALATQTMDGMEKNIRPLLTNALPPGEYREQLVELFFAKFHAKRDPKKILDIAVPVYDKYYSDEEIKGLIQFYATPLGHKALSVMPKVVSELQKAEIGRASCRERV